jgi:2'-5' RNA ligase
VEKETDMMLNAALVPPDWVQEEVDLLTTRVASILGGLEDVAVRPYLLPITGFGNLTSFDARRVLEALVAALGDVREPPMIRFSAPTIAPDGTVRLGISGDVDALADLAGFVPMAVERLRLYVDRRRFWPGLTIGRTDAPASSLDGLRGWIGSDWRASTLSLLRHWDATTAHAEVTVGTGTPIGA